MESQRRFSTQLKAITMAPIIKSSITSCTERIAVCFQQGVYTVTICMWQLHGTHTVVSYLSRVHYSIKNWYKLCRSLTVGSVRGHKFYLIPWLCIVCQNYTKKYIYFIYVYVEHADKFLSFFILMNSIVN